MNASRIPLEHPGVILLEEFIEANGLSKYRVAKETGVEAKALGEICLGKRAISPKVDLQLCTFFGMTPGFFLKWQARYQALEAQREWGKEVQSRIRPLEQPKDHQTYE